VVIRCARIKAEIDERDELDNKGLRIVLNFGHTAGHAIESVSGYSGRYTHGEAVGIGMLVACDIATKMGILKNQALPERLEKMLIRFRLPVRYKGLSEDDILTAIGYDKKSEQRVNRFVLPIDLGRTTLQSDVPVQVIREALRSRKA
jgi:3-dehydroquinate synthase